VAGMRTRLEIVMGEGSLVVGVVSIMLVFKDML